MLSNQCDFLRMRKLIWSFLGSVNVTFRSSVSTLTPSKGRENLVLGCQSMDEEESVSEMCVTRRDESFDLNWQEWREEMEAEGTERTFWFFAGSHPFSLVSSLVIHILLPSYHISWILVFLSSRIDGCRLSLGTDWRFQNSIRAPHQFSSLTVFYFGFLSPFPPLSTSFLLFPDLFGKWFERDMMLFVLT